MKPNVSIVIPSMGRVKRLEDCVKGILDTTPPNAVEVICVIDTDQTSLAHLKDIKQVSTIYNKHRKGAIECWNQGLVAARADLIVFAGDDLEFQPGWYEESLKVMGDLNGDGLVGFNDNHRDGNVLATHYMASRSFIKQHLGGRIAFPIFQFYCNDTVANRLSKNAGKFRWADKAYVVHHHYTSEDNPREKDALDWQNEQLLAGDIRIFHDWMERGSKIEWDSAL